MNSFTKARSIAAVLNASTDRLRAAGIETDRLDARILMAHLLGCDQAWLLGHREDLLPSDAQKSYHHLVERRISHEPVAYLTGVKEFWSLPFRVTPDTLIPRPDSEIVVETALKVLANDVGNVIDLGTGTGCLLLSILHERTTLRGVGIDSSSRALSVAKGNAAALGLSQRAEFLNCRWDDYSSFPSDEKFEVVVSNPPYIPDSDIAGLAADIRCFEPIFALNGGPDGLDAYRKIASCLPMLLAPGGCFVGEFGLGQSLLLRDILRAEGLQIQEIIDDAAGRQRCIIARKEG